MDARSIASRGRVFGPLRLRNSLPLRIGARFAHRQDPRSRPVEPQRLASVASDQQGRKKRRALLSRPEQGQGRCTTSLRPRHIGGRHRQGPPDPRRRGPLRAQARRYWALSRSPHGVLAATGTPPPLSNSLLAHRRRLLVPPLAIRSLSTTPWPSMPPPPLVVTVPCPQWPFPPPRPQLPARVEQRRGRRRHRQRRGRRGL